LNERFAEIHQEFVMIGRKRLAGALFCLIPGLCCAADPPATYVLGAGDELAIWVLGADEISAHPLRVDLNGYVDIPIAGHMRAEGLTVDQLRANLVEQLSTQIKVPRVTVSVTDLRSQPVSVMGAVNKPGVYQLQGRRTLLEVLSMAEGVKSDAGNAVRISRQLDQGPLPLPGAVTQASGSYSVAETGLRDALDSKNPASELIVKPHDVITIAQGQSVYVIGDVNKAGGFPLGQREKISVLQALSLAGGPGTAAKPSAAKILRTSGDGSTRGEIPIDVKRILDGKATDVQLQAEDILFIPDSAGKVAALRAAQAMGIAIWRIP
jgi:polysaccharide export outer membrane protein